MDKRLEEVAEGIQAISSFDGEALTEVSNRLDSVNTGIESLQSINRDLADTVSIGAASIGRNLEAGLEKVSASTTAAGQMVSGSMIAAGAMISIALVGVGAILHYRERMDQVRHQERLEFDELASDAGKARRELKLASALLFVGDASQARKHIERSLRLFPTSADTFRMRSIVESIRSDHAAAALSLKTALRLADENEFLPHVNNINHTISDSVCDAISVSIVSQLAHEMALLEQEQGALELLDERLPNHPWSVDLHYVRLRILCKAGEWDSRYEACVRKIVDLSPQHFNLLFLDRQLGTQLQSTRTCLSRFRDEAEKALRDKCRALISISKGRADLKILDLPESGRGSYVEIRNAANGVGKEMAQYR
jgi:tetratricopeptide (TPR) repeat protein